MEKMPMIVVLSVPDLLAFVLPYCIIRIIIRGTELLLGIRQA